jgi:3alpha(or 20beta)-hydroxysteroid dehydrogenase
MEPRLGGHTVLVTGAAGGIGHATVGRLAAEGATVIASDVGGSDLDAVLSGVRGDHLTLSLDVTCEHDWAKAMARIASRFGHLDALVNNAAIGSVAAVPDEDLSVWNQVIAVGQTGVWLGMKHAAPLIERSTSGSIVNVCSILGSVGGLGNSAAYHAAKGAVRTLTKNAALYWARKGLRVNSIHPGFVGTPGLYERYGGTERHQAMLAGTPLGRLARPAEIASVIAFLVSTDSSYMTGSELYVDGGWTAA